MKLTDFKEIENTKIGLFRKVHCLLFIAMTKFYLFMLKKRFNQEKLLATYTLNGNNQEIAKIYLNGHRTSSSDDVAMYYASIYLILTENNVSKIAAANYIINL